MNPEFNARRLIERLEAFTSVPQTLLSHVTLEEARRKPPTGAWSILEIVCHLVDEEIEDFRARVRMTLESPEREWPPIDPEGVATSRSYNSRELGPMLDAFERERRESIKWLRSLSPNTRWDVARLHPKFGPLHAGMLLASWAAHDQLHLRQIAKRLFELCAVNGEPYETKYAGEWGP